MFLVVLRHTKPTIPKNNQVSGDDPKGTITFCDAGVPNFSPIQYEPEQMVITRPPPAVDTRTKEETRSTETNRKIYLHHHHLEVPVNTAEIECPTQKQLLGGTCWVCL
jgi:hypothetical protein